MSTHRVYDCQALASACDRELVIKESELNLEDTLPTIPLPRLSRLSFGTLQGQITSLVFGPSSGPVVLFDLPVRSWTRRSCVTGDGDLLQARFSEEGTSQQLRQVLVLTANTGPEWEPIPTQQGKEGFQNVVCRLRN